MKGFQAFVGKVVHKIFPAALAKWYDKYQSALWYLFFGVVTTAVNFACYALLKYAFFKETFASCEAKAALICNWENADQAKDEQWITLTAKVNFRFSKAYGRKGPVLTYIEHSECEAPEQPVATFY